MPRHKVCGEYLSGESLSLLEVVGVARPVIERAGVWLDRVSFFSPSGRRASIELRPEQKALSIRRYDLDWILFENAAASGAQTRQGCRVTGHEATDSAVVLKLAAGEEIRASLVIAADGLRSRFAEAAAPQRSGQRLFGFKAYWGNLSLPASEIEMYFTPQGYGGFSPVDAETVNGTFLVSEGLVRSLGGQEEAIFAQGVLSNPVAAERIGPARRLSRWWSTGPIEYGMRRRFGPRVIPVGDALAVTEQFAGEGMGMAIKSALLLAALLRREPELLGDGEALRARYLTLYRRTFAWKMRLLGLLRCAMASREGAESVLAVLRWCPWLFQAFYSWSRSDYRRFSK